MEHALEEQFSRLRVKLPATIVLRERSLLQRDSLHARRAEPEHINRQLRLPLASRAAWERQIQALEALRLLLALIVPLDSIPTLQIQLRVRIVPRDTIRPCRENQFVLPATLVLHNR